MLKSPMYYKNSSLLVWFLECFNQPTYFVPILDGGIFFSIQLGSVPSKLFGSSKDFVNLTKLVKVFNHFFFIFIPKIGQNFALKIGKLVKLTL